jgi:hypothetical protein
MNLVATGQFACTWQALAFSKIAAGNSQDDLSDELLAKWNLTAF